MNARTTHSPDLDWTLFAREALACWNITDATIKHLSLSENATYLVTLNQSSKRYVLRLHRPGYRTHSEIESELVWLEAIEKAKAAQVAPAIPAPDGSKLCTFVNPNGETQHAVLFEFLEGRPPRDAEFGRRIKDIGRIASALHAHSTNWSVPAGFERMTWDVERIFGTTCDYGYWKRTEGISDTMRDTIERVESKLRFELSTYRRHARNYGLIHSDLRPDNLMVGSNGIIKVLDFDDCGFSWFMFDVACTFSFEEANPDLEDLVWAYLNGYREGNGPLSDEDFLYLPTCLMARRLSMLAWVEFRRETPYAQTIHDRFVSDTETIANAYLENRYLGRIVDMAEHRMLPHNLDKVG